MKKTAVLVTTEYRGVFFGFIDPKEMRETTVTLDEARNVIYWSSDVNGFLGLTSNGPTSNCRISNVAGGPIVVHKVTSITACQDSAIQKFQQWKP